MSTQFDPNSYIQGLSAIDDGFQNILQRLNQKMERDQLIQNTTDDLRNFLHVNRVLLYHFYTQWEGQVTVESLSDKKFSISGSTGPNQCFSDEYAALYLEGRVRAIADIETEPIQTCHRDFLRYLQVRANLVVPILTARGLWGLLIAHHCTSSRFWSEVDIERMKKGALILATAPSIKYS